MTSIGSIGFKVSIVRGVVHGGFTQVRDKSKGIGSY